MIIRKIAIIFIFSIVLSACGGGSGGNNKQTDPPANNIEDGSATSPEEPPADTDATEPPTNTDTTDLSEISFLEPVLLPANSAYWFSIFDINKDGALDIIAPLTEGDQWTGYTSSITAFINEGGGAFHRKTLSDLEYPSSYVSIFDVPDTNIIGFYVSTRLGCSIDYYQSDDSGDFQLASSVPSNSCGNRYVLGVDLNNDQVIDSISNGGAINTSSSDGPFTKSHTLLGLYNGVGLALGILDSNSSTVDAVTFDGYETLAVFKGKGDGSFETASLYTALDSQCRTSHGGLVILNDINSDGIKDAIVSNGCQVFSFMGNGDGTFSNSVSANTTYSVMSDFDIADINSDGIPDLILAEANKETSVTIYKGNGDGTFEYFSQVDTGELGAMRVRVADINNDGLLDVIVSHGYHNSISVVLQSDE